MSYATLMVHVEAGTASDTRVGLAASLADRFDAMLIGVAAGAVQLPVMMDGTIGATVDGELMNAERERIEAELKAAEVQFRSIATGGNRRIEWRSAVDFPADVLAREARAADLIILGRDPETARKGIYRSADPGDVLMKAGRPILVPPIGSATLDARRVIVGWKDTREARRAVFDALPFLARAEKVDVVEVCTEEDRDAAQARVEDVAAHLARHGVTARAEARVQLAGTVGGELLLTSELEHADLIVTGGYGHARLREWIFGGVTRDLLGQSLRCCLLAH